MSGPRGQSVCGAVAGGILIGLLAVVPVPAGTSIVEVGADRDNTIYEIDTFLSNGAGWRMFAGRNALAPVGRARRALIRFDVASAVPPEATSIVGVVLTLNCSKSIVGLEPVSVHRVLADWGEGTSAAPGQEGGGTIASTGDATWSRRFFDTISWTTHGGDFVATPSATTLVAGAVGENQEHFWTSPEMIADVEAWLDDPSNNFGWILVGNEAIPADGPTTKRFDTRNHPNAAVRPKLEIFYTTAAGAVPQGSLTVSKEPGGQLGLDWADSCNAGDTDYVIYSGELGNFYSHDPVVCTTLGATALAYTPATNNRYFFVGPRNVDFEGSYGTDSVGNERPVHPGNCTPQSIESPACP